MIRVTSDGKAGSGSKVEVLRDGEPPLDISKYVTRVVWTLDAHDRVAHVELTAVASDVELLAEIVNVVVE